MAVTPFADYYSIATKSTLGKMPALGDIDGDGKYELILINESNELFIMNTEYIKYYQNFLDSNWSKYKDIMKNEKNNRLYGIKLNFGENVISTPLLFDTNNDGIEDIIVSTENNEIIAINAAKLMNDVLNDKYTKLGDYILWKNSMSAASSSGFSLFRIGNKYYGVIGASNEFLYIINLMNGNFYKKIDLHSYSIISKRKPILDSPLIYDINGDNKEDIIVGSNSGVFFAINGKTFSLMWKFSKKNSPILFSPTIVNVKGKIYLACAFKEYKLIVLDASTGTEKWYYNTADPILTAPLAADLTGDGNDNILIATEGGKIICFNAQKGTEPWNFKISKITATPIIYDINGDLSNDIFIANNRGIVEAYNGRTRELIDKYRFVTKGLQALDSQPILGDIDSNGILDLGVNSTDGYFYMFTDPNKLNLFTGKLINSTQKGDLFRTGNIKGNKKVNTILKIYLDNISKKYSYNKAIQYLNSNNITQAAIYLKKVINIDPEYKDAQDQFNAIKNNFLEYEYKNFNEAIKNNNVKKAGVILQDVKTTSSDYKNIPEMDKKLANKIMDYKKADKLFKSGKLLLKSNNIVAGYEQLETAYSLKPFDEKIKQEVNKYSYEMELYRKLIANEKAKKWYDASETLKTLLAKYPNFPGLSSHKSKIQFNKNKFLYLGGVITAIAIIVIIVLSLKRKKKIEEELIQQSVNTEKVEVSTAANNFSTDEGDEEEAGGPSVDEMENSGISLGGNDDAEEINNQEIADNVEIDDSQENEDDDIELGGIDMGLESDKLDEAESPTVEPGTGNVEDENEEEQVENEDIEINSEPQKEDLLEENIEVRMSMAIQLYDNSEFDKAAEEFQKIIDIDKKYKYDAMAYLGFCYYEQKKLDESMKLIQSIPYNTDEIPIEERISVLKILGKGFIKNKLNKPSISVYKKLLTITKGMEKKDTLYHLGEIYESLDDKENAIKYYKDLFLIDSNYKDVSEKLDELGFA